MLKSNGNFSVRNLPFYGIREQFCFALCARLNEKGPKKKKKKAMKHFIWELARWGLFPLRDVVIRPFLTTSPLKR